MMFRALTNAINALTCELRAQRESERDLVNLVLLQRRARKIQKRTERLARKLAQLDDQT